MLYNYHILKDAFAVKKNPADLLRKRGRKALRENLFSIYILCKNSKDIRGYLRFLSKYFIKK